VTRLQTPAHVGSLRIFRLDGDAFVQVNEGELKALLADPTNVLWIDMHGPTPYHQAVMRDVFHFHPLAIEDTINGRQRPKVEEFDGYTFIIINTVERAAAEPRSIEFEEIDIFLGASYLVTVHANANACLEAALQRCMTPGRTLRGEMSIAYAFYALIDKAIDEYFPVIDDIGEEIDQISEIILDQPRQAELVRLYNLKRSLAEVWRIVGQQREMLNILEHDEIVFGQSDRLDYHLRDVLDHAIRISDMVAMYRDTLSSVIDLYMSSFSNRLNVTLKRLTILTLAIGILTLISGFYGMNFARTWQDFEDPAGVPIVLGMMALGVGAILFYVRKLE